MNMTSFSANDLMHTKIIINDMVMRPRIISSTMERYDFSAAPVLRMEMELPMNEYEFMHEKTLKDRNDILNSIYGIKATPAKPYQDLAIMNVIFNEPATIVFWSDKSKTVVKAQNGEPFDPEKGLAMCIAKRAMGNNGNYYNLFKKFLPKKEEPMLNPEAETFVSTYEKAVNQLKQTLTKCFSN